MGLGDRQLDDDVLRNSLKTSAAYADAAADALRTLDANARVAWTAPHVVGTYFVVPNDGWYDGACQEPTVGPGGITTVAELIALLRKISQYLKLLSNRV